MLCTAASVGTGLDPLPEQPCPPHQGVSPLRGRAVRWWALQACSADGGVRPAHLSRGGDDRRRHEPLCGDCVIRERGPSMDRTLPNHVKVHLFTLHSCVHQYLLTLHQANPGTHVDGAPDGPWHALEHLVGGLVPLSCGLSHPPGLCPKPRAGHAERSAK